jgi:hypothetical protein
MTREEAGGIKLETKNAFDSSLEMDILLEFYQVVEKGVVELLRECRWRLRQK